MDGLKFPTSEKIKSECPGLVKRRVATLYVFIAISLTASSSLNLSFAATDSATGITTADINARSYGSKINRRSVSGRVYLFDALDATQDLPQTGRLVLLRNGDSPVMALRVLKQYADKRQYAAKWLRRYSGTKDLEAGSQYITLEKVSDKEAPPLTTQDKKDLKELEAPAAAPIPIEPIQAAAPPPVVAPAPAPAPVAPPAAVQAAPVAPPVATPPAPEAVAPTPEPPTAPVPAPTSIAANAVAAPPPVLPVPAPVATPEPPTPVEMSSPAPVPTQDVVAPPQAPEPTASEAAAPAPPADTAAVPAPTPTDATIPPPASAAVAEQDNIPPPSGNAAAPPSPKTQEVPDTEGETAEAPTGSGDDMSSVMVEELKQFDRDNNSFSVGAGLYRNTLVSGGTASGANAGTGYSTTTIYSSGGMIRYSRTLKHLLNYKSKSLQDSFALDGTVGFYKYLGSTSNSDSYTIAPISVTARYTLLPSETFGIFIYGGFVKNYVVQSANADPYTQAGFNTFFPEVGVGMLFQIGPSWYMRADLGLDLIGLSIALKF